MKRTRLLIVLVFWLIVFSLFCYAEEAPGKEDKPVKAESLEKLVVFAASAIADNDIQRLKQIITGNNQLILENKLLAIQLCSTLLDEAIKNELSDEGQKGDFYYLISKVLAEIYHNAAGSNYLLDKVAIFRKWSKEEKGTYQQGEELYGRGEELRNQYRYDEAVDCYDNGKLPVPQNPINVSVSPTLLAPILSSDSDYSLLLLFYYTGIFEFFQRTATTKKVKRLKAGLWRPPRTTCERSRVPA